MKSMNTLAHSRIKKMSPQLLVSNVELSIGFYTKKLGFEVDFRYEDFYAAISKDGHSIHLKATGSSLGKEDKRDTEDVDIVCSVANIEDLYDELSNRSVELRQTLRDMPYGKEFYVADPDGHIIAFVEES
jgi:catechol 2,3-dioxygenase-like lactoylglutathione lyase family enzyme